MANRLLKLFKNVIIYGITIVYALIKIFIIILVLILIYNIFFAVHKSPDEFVSRMDDYYQKNEKDLTFVSKFIDERQNITDIAGYNHVCSGNKSIVLSDKYRLCYDGEIKISKLEIEKLKRSINKLDIDSIYVDKFIENDERCEIVFLLKSENGVSRSFDYLLSDKCKPNYGVIKHNKSKTIIKKINDNWYYYLSNTPL